MIRALRAGAAVAAATAGLLGCATTQGRSTAQLAPRIEVVTPIDAVPVTDGGVWSTAGDDGAAPERALRELRHDVAETLTAAGADVCEGEAIGPDLPPAGGWQGAIAGDGVDAVVVTELVAYGQLRKSWVWLLAGQAVVAGVGHGVATARLTGNTAAGWWVGLGEWALETVTWVGGALLASHWIDPVIVRVSVYRARDGVRVGRWTREGLRPLRELLGGGPSDPRPERLRAVFRSTCGKLAEKVVTRAARASVPAPRDAGGGRR